MMRPFSTLRSIRRKIVTGLRRYGAIRVLEGIPTLLAYRLRRPTMGSIRTRADDLLLYFRYPSQFMPTLALFHELAEPEYAYLRRTLRPDSVFVDVGGGIGAYSLTAGRIVNGPIHLFEPVTANVETIRMNVDANSMRDKIRINAVALSSEPGFAVMATPENLFGSHIDRVSAVPAANTVPVTTLDLYCAEHQIDRIDVLKIDAEGHERAILKGARRLLTEGRIGALILEADHTLADFYEDLRRVGFRVCYYDEGANTLRRIDPITPETIQVAGSNVVLVQGKA